MIMKCVLLTIDGFGVFSRAKNWVSSDHHEPEFEA
jgi:hypothetical protein